MIEATDPFMELDELSRGSFSCCVKGLRLTQRPTVGNDGPEQVLRLGIRGKQLSPSGIDGVHDLPFPGVRRGGLQIEEGVADC